MRRILLLTAMTVLLAPLPPAGASGEAGLRSTAVQGEGLDAQADEPILFMRPTELPGIHLTAASLTLQWQDDIDTVIASPHPATTGVTESFSDADEDGRSSWGSGTDMVMMDMPGPNATLVVVPTAESSARITQDSRYALSHESDRILEQSHVAAADAIPPDPTYYEYRVRDRLRLDLDGPSRVEITGDFMVYWWGFTVRHIKADDVETFRTGSWRTSNEDSVREDRHNAYLLAFAENGTLTLDTGREPAQVYATRFQAEPHGPVEYTSANGTVPARGGDSYRVDGGEVAVQGADVEWSLSSDPDTLVTTRFVSPAADVTGSNVHRVQAPLLSETTWWALAAAGASLAVVTYTSPNLLSLTISVRYRLPVELRPTRSRSDGYRRMAEHAEAAGRYRLATWLMGRAIRWQPDDPMTWIMRGVHLRQQGAYARALGDHAHAHALLDQSDAVGDSAHNAYEAARAACLAGDVGGAHHWLQTAVQMEPDLAFLARIEPDLAAVRARWGGPVGDGDLMRV